MVVTSTKATLLHWRTVLHSAWVFHPCSHTPDRGRVTVNQMVARAGAMQVHLLMERVSRETTGGSICTDTKVTYCLFRDFI